MPTHTLSCRLSPEIEHSLDIRQQVSRRPTSQLVEAALHYCSEHPRSLSALEHAPTPSDVGEGRSAETRLGKPRKIRLNSSSHQIVVQTAQKYDRSPSQVVRQALRVWMSMTAPDTLGTLPAPPPTSPPSSGEPREPGGPCTPGSAPTVLDTTATDSISKEGS